MISEKTDWRVLVNILMLFITLLIAAFVIVSGRYIYLFFIVPVIIFQLARLYSLQVATHRELVRFFEAVKYEDFTGNYLTAKRTKNSVLKEGFNTINATFRKLSREKETQHQYLQNILELVNTGILCFDTEDGKVIWMNDTLKKMFNLPYLRTVHAFEKRDKVLYEDMVNLKPGKSKVAIVNNDSKSFRILLSAASFLTDNRRYTLLALQNINEVMDETESRAWHKLLSVLTHEIMNSIAPISSLAETIGLRLNEIQRTEASQHILDDLELGITTIKTRSDGLLKFAGTYRNLNKIITPNLTKVYAGKLFESLYTLLQPTLSEKNIEFEIILKDPDLSFNADVNLIEQVLINLILNAIEAVKEQPHPQIAIAAYKIENGKTIIRVSDNGGGIPEVMLDKIFIPFFTTKKNGSGIGLTLCKQIMLLHHGNIEVRNVANGQCDFILTF